MPCLDPDLAPVLACSCAQISIRREPEPGFSLKLVPAFVKAPFEHEKFSAAFQIKFERGTWSPTLESLLANNADRLEINIRPIGELWIQRDYERMGSKGSELEGVTVRICTHRPCRACGAAGSSYVFNDESLPERSRYALAYDAGNDISRSPGRERG
jgi:hypothetical protein